MKNYYLSTRGGQKNISASEGIIKGIASDGGLFVPSFIDHLSLNPEVITTMNYGELTFEILKRFLTDFSEDIIKECIKKAYYSGKFDQAEPVNFKHLQDRTFLELYHGPTCAFKDMALTILPYLMSNAMTIKQIDKDIVILTATSGDTGKAALEGFASVDRIAIVVYYPKEGVSPIQERQMLTQQGQNTCVIGVDGNFDDTQTGVKKILNDPVLIQKLDAMGYHFSSANSINIGRLLPQIVYYYYSYAEMVQKGTIANGDLLNFVVPTGNFGDILAGYYAKKLGLPINRLICASNSNNILTDFFKTGVYDRNRPFHKTTSPSMDILISSNLERLLYDLYDGDTKIIAQLMADLNEKGQYRVSDAVKKQLDDSFYANFADENKTAEEIKKRYTEDGYLIDPHTAVASAVYNTYLEETQDLTKTVVLSTASPYKFATTVYKSLFGSLPEGKSDFDILKDLSEKTKTSIPKNLQNLDQKELLHHGTCTPSQMAMAAQTFLKEGTF